MKNYSDEELINLSAKGNKNALETLVKRYLKIVYGASFRYARNSEDAEDIAQEVFIKVWKNLNRFKDGKKFRPWLCEIAKNTALDFLKKKSPISFSRLDSGQENNPDLFDNLGKNIIESPAVIVDRFFLANKLSFVIKILSPKYAEIISLRHNRELNFAEIAILK